MGLKDTLVTTGKIPLWYAKVPEILAVDIFPFSLRYKFDHVHTIM